jgi:dephospho-CoA kinase
MLVGIVGFIGSGKGTVGDLFAKRGFVKDSFAKPLKDAASNIFGWPRELLEGDTEISRKWRENPDPFWSDIFGREFTPREALQKLGTEAGRDVFHKDIWVASLINRTQGKDVVVTDVRFSNEIEYIQKNDGIVVRVKRGSDPVWFEELSKIIDPISRNNFMKQFDVHPSEWDWVGCYFNYTVENNGSIHDLGEKIDELLRYHI